MWLCDFQLEISLHLTHPDISASTREAINSFNLLNIYGGNSRNEMSQELLNQILRRV